MDGKVPVYVITGLLGAGKTTLVTHMLKQDHGLKLIVIQNELSEEMGIEAPIITQGAVDFYELPNGCVCCSAKSGLVSALEASMELMRSRAESNTASIDGILVETTGVADPCGVVETFWSEDYDSLYLSAVVTVIDCVTAVAISSGSYWKELRSIFFKQLALADVVLLNKVDMGDSSEAEAVIRAATNSECMLFPVSYSQVDVHALLAVHAYSSGTVPEGRAVKHSHQIPVDHELFVWTPSLRRSRDEWTRLIGNILWNAQSQIFRCKGIAQDEQGRAMMLQGVGEIFEWKYLPHSPILHEDKILFVGLSLDRDALRRSLI